MIKKKKIVGAYITQAFCDKCGAPLESTGICLTTYPAQYPYKCSNPDCDFTYTFWEKEIPGKLIYEYAPDFVEDENV